MKKENGSSTKVRYAEHAVKLMTAYRLHFDEANMRVVDLIKSQK